MEQNPLSKDTGRNEDFNTQKNQGYYIQHKFSERSVDALYVYYILMQMVHIVNQIVEYSKPVRTLLSRHRKLSIRYLWDRLRYVIENILLNYDFLNQNNNRCQIRLFHEISQT